MYNFTQWHFKQLRTEKKIHPYGLYDYTVIFISADLNYHMKITFFLPEKTFLVFRIKQDF